MANNGGGFAGWDGVRREDEEAEDEEEEENGGRVLEAWERAYADERSWEDLQEDESGLLRSTDAKNIAHAQYRRRLLQRSNLGASRVQKGSSDTFTLSLIFREQLQKQIIVLVVWLLLLNVFEEFLRGS
ncbi:hypothetical protein HPP92_015147 [Vanilla planifolia]|uniref:Uncharacterized protein n=1 Tax=Vanilla planifolia TaxID=51239 RepID=A0A835UUU0_VANPL|nr:hypothetical protein HPP92_015147 [Vanilla planifolia]